MKSFIFLVLLGWLQIFPATAAETQEQAKQNSTKTTCNMLRNTYAAACKADANSKYCSMVPPGCPESSGTTAPR